MIIGSNGILDALSSYYRLFALGLGSDANSEFAAWVKPFQNSSLVSACGGL
jgi:hypothetical protein